MWLKFYYFAEAKMRALSLNITRHVLFQAPILCSHVTALANLFCLVFLCNSISFILSYVSARPCPACLRPNPNNSLTIWTRQPCNTTNTFLSYQHYSSSFNEKFNNSFITGLPSDLIQRTRCSVKSCIKMNKSICRALKDADL